LNYTRIAAILCALAVAHNQTHVSPKVSQSVRFSSGELHQLLADVVSMQHADERFGSVLDALGDGFSVA